METRSTTTAAVGVAAGLAAQAGGPPPPSWFSENMSAVDSADHSEPVSRVNNGGDPTDVKDPKVLRLSKKAVDNILAQINTQMSRISSMRDDQVPEASGKEYTRQLASLFDQ